MSFATDLKRFNEKVEARAQAIFVDTVTAVHQSIVEGSEVTGAPGQPVDTGALRASWQIMFESADRALVATHLEYAPYIEDGENSRGPFTLRSQVGGFHSVKLTQAGFDLLVAKATERQGTLTMRYTLSDYRH